MLLAGPRGALGIPPSRFHAHRRSAVPEERREIRKLSLQRQLPEPGPSIQSRDVPERAPAADGQAQKHAHGRDEAGYHLGPSVTGRRSSRRSAGLCRRFGSAHVSLQPELSRQALILVTVELAPAGLTYLVQARFLDGAKGRVFSVVLKKVLPRGPDMLGSLLLVFLDSVLLERQ